MKGGIYSDFKCGVCGGTLKDDERKKVCCPDHPDQIATNFRVHFDKVKRRFKSYESAMPFLTGQRYKTDEHAFDERDYSKEKPLAFMTLASKWLCTYISIRPGELIKIREQDVDTENRYIYIHHSKTGETKPVSILDEDVALFKQIKPGLPRSHFFRHEDSKIRSTYPTLLSSFKKSKRLISA